jgi:hypothetical protein
MCHDSCKSIKSVFDWVLPVHSSLNYVSAMYSPHLRLLNKRLGKRLDNWSLAPYPDWGYKSLPNRFNKRGAATPLGERSQLAGRKAVEKRGASKCKLWPKCTNQPDRASIIFEILPVVHLGTHIKTLREKVNKRVEDNEKHVPLNLKPWFGCTRLRIDTSITSI